MKKILIKIFLIFLLQDNFCLTKISLKNKKKSLISLGTTVLYVLINSIFNKINIDKQNSIWQNETEKKIQIKLKIKAFFLKLEDELFEFIKKDLEKREEKTGENVLDIFLSREKVFNKEEYLYLANITNMANKAKESENFESDYYTGTPRGFFWITNPSFNSGHFYSYLTGKNFSVEKYKFNFLEMIKYLKGINLEEFIKNEENKSKKEEKDLGPKSRKENISKLNNKNEERGVKKDLDIEKKRENIYKDIVLFYINTIKGNIISHINKNNRNIENNFLGYNLKENNYNVDEGLKELYKSYVDNGDLKSYLDKINEEDFKKKEKKEKPEEIDKLKEELRNKIELNKFKFIDLIKPFWMRTGLDENR